MPKENVGQIKKTIELALSLNLDWCNIAVVQALPNTPMWDDFVKLNDPRVFSPNKYSPATATKEKGVSIDDLNFNILNFDEYKNDKILSFKDLNNIWYPVNTKINFLNNINFSDNKKTWKIKNYLSTLHRIFPLDPTIHVALAKNVKIQMI